AGVDGLAFRLEVPRPQDAGPLHDVLHVRFVQPLEIGVAIAVGEVVPGNPECSIHCSSPPSGSVAGGRPYDACSEGCTEEAGLTNARPACELCIRIAAP